MIRTCAILFLSLVGLPMAAQPVIAQEQDTAALASHVRIVMQNGTAYIGIVEREDADTIQIRTTDGVVIAVPRSQVEAVLALEPDLVDGRFQRVDPNRTRLLFAPTARPLQSGEGYFAVYEIFFPFVAVGVLDRISMAGGMSIVPAVSEQVIYLAPKVTVFDGRQADAAVGLLYGTTTAFDGGGGLVYGLGTVGSSLRAVSIGVGFAFGNGEFESRPAFVLGGEVQVSNSLKFISENYAVVGEDGGVVVSGAIRFFGDQLAADLGLFTIPELITESEGFPFIPLVSFAYNFGR